MMGITEILHKAIVKASETLDLEKVSFSLEPSNNKVYGDYATNVALIVAKKAKKNPRDVSEMIARELRDQHIPGVSKIETAGAGFINFFLSEVFFTECIKDILDKKENFGKGKTFAGKRIIVEHTDPNPFKEFHVGHLMPNVIGGTLARLYEWQGAEVMEANYQGDVGLHVACAVWAMKNKLPKIPEESETLEKKIEYLAKAYVYGRKAYDKTDFFGALFGGPTKYDIRKQISEINKKIYEKSDSEINKLYELGRKWSLDYFEGIYRTLGTKFDFYFFESVASPRGLAMVKKNVSKGVFEESNGATIFRGEKHGLHTRVFINKEGLPTYEAKELALPSMKYEAYPYDLSLVVTANEINEYFLVLLKVLEEIEPELARKTIHVGHGVLKLPTGKMSSRTGDVIRAEALIENVSSLIRIKMKDQDIEISEKEKIAKEIALSAIKFTILRQSIGKDIVFDFDTSISFEGDSGPYLQYTTVRARSALSKAEKLGKKRNTNILSKGESSLERLLCRFPEVVERAADKKAPQLVVTYLLEVASVFNAYYAQNKIVDDSVDSPYRLALTEAVAITITNGLTILGIQVPEKM